MPRRTTTSGDPGCAVWCDGVVRHEKAELAAVVHSGAVGVQHAVAEDGGAKVGEQPVAVEAVHRRL
jgi:hypothetical protein